MNDIYRYRSMLRSAEYVTTEEGVDVTSRRLGRRMRVLVPYDKVPMRSSTITSSSRPLLWTAVVLLVLFAIVVVSRAVGAHTDSDALKGYGFLIVLVLGLWVGTRTMSEVFAFEDFHLSFFRRASDDDGKLAAFIEGMQRQKLDFLEQRLTRRAADVPSEEAARYLLYLRESDLIDEAGYTRLRAFITGLYSNRSSMGFQREPAERAERSVADDRRAGE